MVRYKATISYDGTLFSGFQRQPNARSIQEELEKLTTIKSDFEAGKISEFEKGEDNNIEKIIMDRFE